MHSAIRNEKSLLNACKKIANSLLNQPIKVNAGSPSGLPSLALLVVRLDEKTCALGSFEFKLDRLIASLNREYAELDRNVGNFFGTGLVHRVSHIRSKANRLNPRLSSAVLEGARLRGMADQIIKEYGDRMLIARYERRWFGYSN